MRACPRCGTSNPDGAATCAMCGGPFESAPAPRAAPAAGLKQTMLGMALAPGGGPPAPAASHPGGGQHAPPAASAASPMARMGGTMIGMTSPLAGHAPPAQQPPIAPATPQVAATAAPASAAAARAPASLGLKQTMLGFGPGSAPAVTHPQQQQPQHQPPHQQPQYQPPQHQAPQHQAPQYQAPPHQPAQQPPPAPAGGTPGFASTMLLASPGAPASAAAAAAAAAAPPGSRAGAQRTMLGVALPGIAPLHPGHSKQEPVPTPPVSRPLAAPPPPAEARPVPRVELEEDPLPRRPGLPKGAIVLIAVSAVLAVTAGVVAFLWEAPRPITATVVLDERGAEALALGCEDCADGTTLAIGASKATFKSKKTQLLLPRPLDVGKNEIAVAVHRPGMGRDEEVRLAVTVDYRVRGDLSALSEDPPKVKVLVQAAPTAAVVVDGRPVALDASGKGEHAVDVARDLEGPSESIQPFERKLPYVVTPAGGEPRRGEVSLRFGIAPLRIDAPGDGIVVEGETFMLSGHTLKDGRISVSGRPITVDAEGRFAQLMNVSSVGETTIVVRAEAKDHAPRLVRVRVKRVASLRDEAAAFRESASIDYPTIVGGTASKGQSVVLDGEVVESRLDGEVTVLLLEVKKGCAEPPCLAKVVYGGRFETKRAAPVGAYGHLLGMVDGPRTGVMIPELAAEFLLPGKTR